MRTMRFLVAALAAFGMTALVAAPASAQQQEGLVNVNVSDIGVVAQVPIGVAANVCDVNAAVLVQQFRDTGDATCNADSTQLTRAEQRQLRIGDGGGGPQQEGLVNVNVSDIGVIAQVPIGIAANVCDVNAAILVQEFRDTGSAQCDAEASQFTRAQQRQIRLTGLIPTA